MELRLNPVDQIILSAEDDDNDAFLLQRAFEQAGIIHRLVVVEDGKVAIDYLAGNGVYADRAAYPFPCLVLLDLKMPGVSGIEVLRWLRATPRTCALPVLVLTSSNQETDVHRAYVQGANGYLVKPSRLREMVIMAKAVKDYWLVHNRPSSCSDAGGALPSPLGGPTVLQKH